MTEQGADEIAGTKEALVIDAETQTVVATPPKIDLATAVDVRREMAKVYREMKSGKLDTQDGSRLVYVLDRIGRMIEVSEIERRLAALEERYGSKLLAPARQA